MVEPIDIITKDNHLSGKQTTPDQATDRGQWHRGSHGVLITPTGKVLVQKRSLDQLQYPGLVEIGVGGFVNHGETPEEALIREIKEETGLDVRQDQLLFLGTSKYTRTWRFKNKPKLTKAIIYSYGVRLDSDNHHVITDPREASWAGFVPLRTAMWMLHRGSLKRLGTVLPLRRYYRRVVRQMMRFIRT